MDPKDENLWKEFEKAFDVAFTDLVDQQQAHQQLINLKMQGGDLDTYTANFNHLAKRAGFKHDKKGAMELYKQGLNVRLLSGSLTSDG
jgi:NAD-dependent SIR2 family protein deacetylase